MGLVKRSEKIAYYGVKGTGETFIFHRMTNFTDFSVSKNPKEYNRQYVDMDFEEADVIGYSESVSYGFDQTTGNAVHVDIAKIGDDELVGDAAIRPIIFVDKTQAGTPIGSFLAIKRDFAVIPDSEGGSMDAYTYSGNMKVKGETIKGTAISADNFKTVTFTAATKNP